MKWECDILTDNVKSYDLECAGSFSLILISTHFLVIEPVADANGLLLAGFKIEHTDLQYLRVYSYGPT